MKVVEGNGEEKGMREKDQGWRGEGERMKEVESNEKDRERKIIICHVKDPP